MSTDAGLTFHPINFPADLAVNGISPNVWGLSQDPSGNTYVFALDESKQKIYRSDDHGSTWFLFASLSGIGASAKYTDALPTFTPHPLNPNIVFTLDKSRDLLKIVYDPTTKSVNYSSLNVFNSLPSWMPAAVKTFIQIRHIAIDPINPKVMYISTIAAGIPSFYRSLDGGNSWQSISDDLPYLPGIPAVNPHTREVYRGSLNGTNIYSAKLPDPIPPVANAGFDQTVNEGVSVILDGTASFDPDNDILTYLWTAPTGITLSSTSASKPTFTAPEVTSNTNYTFSLVVNDGTMNSTADQVIITVMQVNKSPIVNAGINQVVNEGVLVTLDGTASSDPDNDVLTYLWSAPAGITLSSTSASKPTFTTPEVSSSTNYTFSLIVNDGTMNSTADQVVITVSQINSTDPDINDQKMIVYPNPTSGKVTIIFDKVYEIGSYLTVSDLNGKTVLKKFIYDMELTIDLTEYPSGIYLIKPSMISIKGQKIILN